METLLVIRYLINMILAIVGGFIWFFIIRSWINDLLRAYYMWRVKRLFKKLNQKYPTDKEIEAVHKQFQDKQDKI